MRAPQESRNKREGRYCGTYRDRRVRSHNRFAEMGGLWPLIVLSGRRVIKDYGLVRMLP